MQMVYEAGNIIDAHLVRHALEHAGIPAFVRGEALLGGMGELPVSGMVSVCVPVVYWPDACEVLRALPLLADPSVADPSVADPSVTDASDGRDTEAGTVDAAASWDPGAV